MKNIYLILTCTLLFLSGCVQDPLKEVKKGGWNNEKSIFSIKFENQIGDAIIKRVDDASGTVNLKLNVNDKIDLSNLKIEELIMSYQATSNVSVGSTLNFGNAESSNTLTVTSNTGKQRIYTVKVEPFIETFSGTWDIDALSLYGGTGPEYGGAGIFTLESKAWLWSTTDGANKELDNYLIVELVGVTKEGHTYGTINNNAGTDGKYANFVFIGSGKPQTDVNNFYRKIPTGEATWVRNYEDGTITFTFADGTTTTGEFAGPGTEDLGNGKTKVINNNALAFNLKGVDDWDNIYNDYDRVVKNPRRYWIEMTKRQ